MPPERSRKYRERLVLAQQIELSGIEMPDCTNCASHHRRCVVSSQSTRCAECVRRGVRCDVGVPSVGDWAAIEREEARLKKLEDEAMEAIMRLPRIQKQKEFLRKRAAEMLRRGLKTLDELDAADAADKERLEQEEAARALVSGVLEDPAFSVNAGSGGLFLDLGPDQAFWESLGVVDGTPQEGPGTGG